tara:strand:+ start:104 stop:577 length:474 start_codon:yes stop_codon:yes gene_type:complete
MSSSTKSTIKSALKVYVKKLKIYLGLIINEYGGEESDLEFIFRGETPNRNPKFDTFILVFHKQEWGKRQLSMKFDIRTKWKEVKARIEKGIATITEIQERGAGRCPCCYEDLDDVKDMKNCAVCSAIVCESCVDKIRNGNRGRFKCPLCRQEYKKYD